jgi:hypothetical protein
MPSIDAHASTFSSALAQAQQSTAAPAHAEYLSDTLKPLTNALESVNGEAQQLSAIASSVEQFGGSLSPGDAIMLSMQCSEFMFHCQLTATAANQSADGLQQLFKEQG